MKSFNKALSAAALLAVSGLSFAAEPMVLGANDLDQVNAGWGTTWGTASGANTSTSGLAMGTAYSTSSSVSGATVSPFSSSTAIAQGGTAFNGSISAETYANAGFNVTP